jgi:NAD-reducing hydrogenase small subunit
MNRLRLATVWLDGCSGCHMSLLDMDERLLELGEQLDLVYSPLVDQKVFPEGVDVTLVEGAVSSEADLEKIEIVRARTRVLVSLGDCAVTGNVPSMRNPVGVDAILKHAYESTVDVQPQIPVEGVPRLLERVRPVHEVVLVDLCVPGCPPSADTIYTILSDLLAGRTPDPAVLTRFGA